MTVSYNWITHNDSFNPIYILMLICMEAKTHWAIAMQHTERGFLHIFSLFISFFWEKLWIYRVFVSFFRAVVYVHHEYKGFSISTLNSLQKAAKWIFLFFFSSNANRIIKYNKKSSMTISNEERARKKTHNYYHFLNEQKYKKMRKFSLSYCESLRPFYF